MAEIIVTLDEGREEPIVRIHPWIYDLSSSDGHPAPMRVKILPGLSPIRQALLARKALPEQELHAWEKISVQRIRIGTDTAPPVVEAASDVDSATRERIIAQLAEALQNASGDAIEHHATGFGNIIVAKIEEPYYFALALGSAWPMPVLEVHRMNRADGSTEPVDAYSKLSALDITAILEIYRSMRQGKKGASHVER
ncbi:MAG TPA: hypothetical protein VMU69_31325 [Bradyrhizobium sp.]|nr:hypothetical protein [Bradyrhizobium sp.]